MLADQSRLTPDTVICATGYRRGLEPIVGHLGVLRPDGLPIRYKGTPELATAPCLYFAGFWVVPADRSDGHRLSRAESAEPRRRTQGPDRAECGASASVLGSHAASTM